MIDLYTNQTATWKKKNSTNDYNDPSFDADQTIKCRIDYGTRMVRDAQRQTIVSEVQLFTKSAVSPDDHIVINGIEYPVISVANIADLNGTVTHYEVML